MRYSLGGKKSRRRNRYPGGNMIILCFIGIIMVLGLIIGAIYGDYAKTEIIIEMVDGLYYSSVNTNASLVNTFLKYLRIAVILWISGFFTAGAAVIISMLFIRSFAYGFTMSAFISHYGIHGLVMAFNTYILQNIFLIAAMIFLSFYGIINIINKINNMKRDRVTQGFVLIIGVLCAAIASLIEIYITPLLLS